jgi:hypothetical protein
MNNQLKDLIIHYFLEIEKQLWCYKQQLLKKNDKYYILKETKSRVQIKACLGSI